MPTQHSMASTCFPISRGKTPARRTRPCIGDSASKWRCTQGDWKLVKYSNEFAAEKSDDLLSPLRGL